VPVLSFWGINMIAAEIEQPFGDDVNDLPTHELQRELNATLLLLLDPPLGRVPQLKPTAILDMRKLREMHFEVAMPSAWQGGESVFKRCPKEAYHFLEDHIHIPGHQHKHKEDHVNETRDATNAPTELPLPAKSDEERGDPGSGGPVQPNAGDPLSPPAAPVLRPWCDPPQLTNRQMSPPIMVGLPQSRLDELTPQANANDNRNGIVNGDNISVELEQGTRGLLCEPGTRGQSDVPDECVSPTFQGRPPIEEPINFLRSSQRSVPR